MCLIANLYTLLTALSHKSHVLSSSTINSLCFLLISFKAFPTDFLTYSLLSFVYGEISSTKNIKSHNKSNHS